MNFLEATVSNGGLDLDDDIRLPLPPGLSPSDGAKVTIGIRPEHLDPVYGGGTSLQFAVDMVENLGSTQLIHGRLENGALVIAEQRGAPPVRPGEALQVPLDPARVLLFEAEGSRLR